MFKEIGICVLIVIIIFVLDTITLNYLEKTISDATDNLQEIKEKVLADEKNDEEIYKLVKDAYDKWLNYHDNLAVYIEHNELEKVETEFSALIGEIEAKDYEGSVNELNKTVYILNHIEHKYRVSLDNIF